MPIVYLGLGSNLEPAHHLCLGVRELARRFELVDASKVYRNPALGFEGAEFLNAVVSIESDLEVSAIVAALDEIHSMAGRVRGDKAFVSRTLDIDLLMVGDAVIPEWRIPRPDVLDYGFVLRPLAEIAPDLRHPLTGKTMHAHWTEFDQDGHRLDEDPLILLNGVE